MSRIYELLLDVIFIASGEDHMQDYLENVEPRFWRLGVKRIECFSCANCRIEFPKVKSEIKLFRVLESPFTQVCPA